MKKTTSFIICFFFSSFIINGQVPILESKNISECQTNCPIDEKATVNEKNSILNVQIGISLNCIVDNNSNFFYEFKNDSLIIKFDEFKISNDSTHHKPNDTIISKIEINDSTTRIIEEITFYEIGNTKEWMLCDCYFIVDLSFSNYPFVPKTILVNRKRVIIEENK